MKKMMLSEVAAAIGAKFDGQDREVFNISSDSRKITDGSLFLALAGEHFDGHNYVKTALEKGAVGAVVCELFPRIEGAPLLYVNSTQRALLDIGRHYRKKFNIPVVGVTGSVGKTTTKDLTAAVLSVKYKTLKTQGNHNNEIGLPHTLLELDQSFEAAVIEMGMSNLGEISLLSRTALPTAAIITKIGVSHMETLGSRDNILKAKLEIADGLEQGGALIVNGDDDKLSTIGNDFHGHRVIRFGVENSAAAVRAGNIKQRGDGMRFDIMYEGNRYEASVPAIGMHIVYDALAAFAAGAVCGVTPRMCVEGLRKYTPSGMRQKVVNYKGITIIEDCYNASPDSMHASIDTLTSFSADGRKIAVLGDMLELGEISSRAHEEVGEYAAKKGVDMLFLCGEQKGCIAEGAKRAGGCVVEVFDEKKTLAYHLKSELKSGDAVLVKASRGMQFEDILKFIYGEC